MIVVGEEFIWWPREETPPAPAEAHEVYGSHDAADSALSTHIATNPDLGMDKNAYRILRREVGDWR